MRKFLLENTNGQILDLNELGSFLYDPEGLGFIRNADYYRFNNQFVPLTDNIVQPSPEGVIRFGDYGSYTDFIKFIQFSPLLLHYTPEDRTFYLECDVREAGKTEMESNGLNVPIKFLGRGLWYEKFFYSSDSEVSGGKVYSFTYPYAYSDSTSGSIIIDSESAIESPTKYIINGPAVNPSWTHLLDGKVYATGKVKCTIPAGRRLVISTLGGYSIKETDMAGNVIRDRYQNSDWSTQRFSLIQRGKNQISFNHEGANDINVILEGRVYYESV